MSSLRSIIPELHPVAILQLLSTIRKICYAINLRANAILMVVIVDENIFLEKLIEALTQVQDRNLGGSPNSPDQWLTPAQTRELLGIGRTKYFAMKAEGAFTFSQFGRTSKISRKSLETFLKKNIVK